MLVIHVILSTGNTRFDEGALALFFSSPALVANQLVEFRQEEGFRERFVAFATNGSRMRRYAEHGS